MQPQAGSAMTPRDVFSRFISLGENCEFGLVQVKFGLQPFSLFAFAFNRLKGLTLALADRLAQIADPSKFDLAPIGRAQGPNGEREYILTHKTYGTVVHTQRFEGRVDPQELMKAQIDRLSYLRDEFIDDMRQGDRIAIFKSSYSEYPDKGQPSFAAIDNLQQLILKHYGPTQLLWAAVADRRELVGAVHPLGPVLVKGYVSRFADPEDATKFESQDWLKLCSNTLKFLENGRLKQVIAPAIAGNEAA